MKQNLWLCFLCQGAKSLANIHAANSPALARHHALPGHVATGPVIVVTDGIIIYRAPVTETKAAMAEAANVETPAMTTTPAMTAAMGRGSRTGQAEQGSRRADNPETANGEQGHGRQAARQAVAIARTVLSHRYFPSLTRAHTGKLAKIIVKNGRFLARRGSNHLGVILNQPADRHIAASFAS
jgi:hypothetical protein